MTAAETSTRARSPWTRAVPIAVVAIGLIVVPQVLNEFWTNRVSGWIPFAVAALGLTLLTGFNGQISVGHGALYGVGASSTALVINHWHWPYLLAIAFSGLLCFVVGLVIGLPAARITGLYLALVTLSAAALVPQVLEQFSSVTGGSAGLDITSPELNSRGVMTDRAIRFDPPGWSGLAADQWRYYVLLAVAALTFLIVRNIIKSRAGRSIVAIRDNETAAKVSGVNVASTRVLIFGISSALAGIGGSMLALYLATQPARLSSGSFTLATSLYFLVAVVVGGSQSIIGPAIGAIVLGVFSDVITPELPESMKPATPLILGVLLIVMMRVAPGGLVGFVQGLKTRFRDPGTGNTSKRSTPIVES